MTKNQEEADKSAPERTEPSSDDSFGRTLIQFFVIPALVVALCVGVFFFFAWLVSDEKTSVDYLQEVRVGSANRRWQAAFELSKLITMDSERSRQPWWFPGELAWFQYRNREKPSVISCGGNGKV